MSHFEGFRRLAPFGTAVRNRGGAEPGGPATAGRVNSYCRPALPPGNRWLARRTASLAASRDSVGARMSPRLVPGLLSRGGAPRAAMDKRLRVLKPCLRSWPKNGPARVNEAADGSSDGSGQVSSTGLSHVVFLLCGYASLAGRPKNTQYAAITLQSALPGTRIGRCIGCGDNWSSSVIGAIDCRGTQLAACG